MRSESFLFSSLASNVSRLTCIALFSLPLAFGQLRWPHIGLGAQGALPTLSRNAGGVGPSALSGFARLRLRRASSTPRRRGCHSVASLVKSIPKRNPVKHYAIPC